MSKLLSVASMKKAEIRKTITGYINVYLVEGIIKTGAVHNTLHEAEDESATESATSWKYFDTIEITAEL